MPQAPSFLGSQDHYWWQDQQEGPAATTKCLYGSRFQSLGGAHVPSMRAPYLHWSMSPTPFANSPPRKDSTNCYLSTLGTEMSTSTCPEGMCSARCPVQNRKVDPSIALLHQDNSSGRSTDISLEKSHSLWYFCLILC